jgi:hypothetical protein
MRAAHGAHRNATQDRRSRSDVRFDIRCTARRNGMKRISDAARIRVRER